MSDAKTTHSATGLELSRRDLIMATRRDGDARGGRRRLAEPTRRSPALIETARGVVFETNVRGERAPASPAFSSPTVERSSAPASTAATACRSRPGWRFSS